MIAAKAAGADRVVDVEQEDLDATVTGDGRGRFDRHRRRTCYAGKRHEADAKEWRRPVRRCAPGTPEGFSVNDLLVRRLTLKPCRGHSYEAVELAPRYIASKRLPLHLLATHRFGLADVDLAVRWVGGQGAPGAVQVTVMPWM